jgi:hypothetical protein
VEQEMNWALIIVGTILLIFSPFSFTASIVYRMTIKRRALLLGFLTTCSIVGGVLIGHATGVLPLDPLNLVCAGSLFSFIILLMTMGTYWRMRWGQKQWSRRYSQLDIPAWLIKLYKQMHDIEDGTK